MTFYIIPSPIGNLDDITIRAIDVITKVDFLVVENRTITKKLLKRLKLGKKKIFTYNDHSNDAKRQNIVEQLKRGLIGGIISDAGTPLISDPGYKLISELISNNIPQSKKCNMLQNAVQQPKKAWPRARRARAGPILVVELHFAT